MSDKQQLLYSTFPEKKRITVDFAVDQMGFGSFQVFIFLVCGFAYMVEAVELTVLTVLTPTLACDWRLTPTERALINVVVFIGMLLGSVAWGKVTDLYGRKFSLSLSSFCLFYFGSLTSLSSNLVWLLVLRSLTGFAAAGAPQSVTALAEFLPSKYRGAFLNSMGCFFTFGAFMSTGLAAIIVPSFSWRLHIFLCSTPALVFLICSYFFPESPRFESIAGKSNSVREGLERIARWNRTELPEGEFYVEKTERGQLKDLFEKEYLKSTVLLWVMWSTQAFLFYGIMLFATEMYRQLAVTDEDKCISDIQSSREGDCFAKCEKLKVHDYADLLITIISEFIAIGVGISLSEWLGRRKTMAIFYIVFTLFMAMTSICVPRSLLTFLLSVSRGAVTGFGSVVVAYTSELFPTKVRALGMGTCVGVSRLGSMLTPFAAQLLFEVNFRMSIAIYCATGILGALAALFLPIETMGRTLKDT